MGVKYSECSYIGEFFSLTPSAYHKIGEDVYSDACQTLMYIAHGYDIGRRVSVLKDPSQTSEISVRIVDAKAALLDKSLPMIFVFFRHETREITSLGSNSIKWEKRQLTANRRAAPHPPPTDLQLAPAPTRL